MYALHTVKLQQGAEAQGFFTNLIGSVVNPVGRLIGGLIPNIQRLPAPAPGRDNSGQFLTQKFEVASQPCRAIELYQPRSTEVCQRAIH
jgi:hypothetical protein